MLRFITGTDKAKEKAANEAALRESRLKRKGEYDKKYEKVKRERKFDEAWQKTRDWLKNESQGMICLCKLIKSFTGNEIDNTYVHDVILHIFS